MKEDAKPWDVEYGTFSIGWGGNFRMDSSRNGMVLML